MPTRRKRIELELVGGPRDGEVFLSKAWEGDLVQTPPADFRISETGDLVLDAYPKFTYRFDPAASSLTKWVFRWAAVERRTESF